ncbi:MAG: orotate phosphoribosyltransferase [Nitriliruptoraceae bacterium]|nr:orotate phosphoribosyltransferase [Nitriliruptoraceae bacterium]
MSVTPTAARLIDLLLDADALRFGDFVGKSGRAMPYFVNLGAVQRGDHLTRLGRCYADALVDRFGHGIDVVFGPAYKGIPIAVSTAIALAEHHDLHVGVAFDRKEAKDHGEGGQLVGHAFADGDRVVILEDVTTAGTSIRATMPLLAGAAAVEVVGLLVGVDRRERAPDDPRSALRVLAEEFDLETAAIATVDDIVAHLSGPGAPRTLGDEDLARIAAYRARFGAS